MWITFSLKIHKGLKIKEKNCLAKCIFHKAKPKTLEIVLDCSMTWKNPNILFGQPSIS